MARYNDEPLLELIAEFIVWQHCHLEEAYRRAMDYYGGGSRGLWTEEDRRRTLDRLRKKYPSDSGRREQVARERGFPGLRVGSILGTWHFQDEAHYRNGQAAELRELASRVAAELESADREAAEAKTADARNRAHAERARDRARRLSKHIRDASAELRRALEDLPK